ncbi:MAG: CoA transferase, partial [Pseudomonadota bacterium]
AGAVLSVADALAHPQVTGRDFLAEFTDVPGVESPVQLARIGAMIDGVRPKVDTPPPALGQHSDEIMRGLGYSAGEITALRKKGVI